MYFPLGKAALASHKLGVPIRTNIPGTSMPSRLPVRYARSQLAQPLLGHQRYRPTTKRLSVSATSTCARCSRTAKPSPSYFVIMI